MNTERKALPSIHIQAAMALMLIQLVHKIVREIPGAFNMGGPGVVGVPVFVVLLGKIGSRRKYIFLQWASLKLYRQQRKSNQR